MVTLQCPPDPKLRPPPPLEWVQLYDPDILEPRKLDKKVIGGFTKDMLEPRKVDKNVIGGFIKDFSRNLI